MNLLKFMNEFDCKKLSIIIPVYNEERTLRKLINAVEAVSLPLKKEIILVDDGSTDGSREILNQLIHIPTSQVGYPQVVYFCLRTRILAR